MFAPRDDSSRVTIVPPPYPIRQPMYGILYPLLGLRLERVGQDASLAPLEEHGRASTQVTQDARVPPAEQALVLHPIPPIPTQEGDTPACTLHAKKLLGDHPPPRPPPWARHEAGGKVLGSVRERRASTQVKQAGDTDKPPKENPPPLQPPPLGRECSVQGRAEGSIVKQGGISLQVLWHQFQLRPE